MNVQLVKHELQNILSGKSGSSDDVLIQTITSQLRGNESASRVVENKFKNKAEETAFILKFARSDNLLLQAIDQEDFVSSGAEQKVFIENNKTVLKLNDAIYYSSWLDYFHNLLLHNYFFADTAYDFVGFHLSEDVLYAVVKQPFIKSDAFTDLGNVKTFLTSNGFENNRNHDYYHPELGIILEDLHDENVLTRKGVLYFIDTVFFVKKEVFWD